MGPREAAALLWHARNSVPTGGLLNVTGASFSLAQAIVINADRAGPRDVVGTVFKCLDELVGDLEWNWTKALTDADETFLERLTQRGVARDLYVGWGGPTEGKERLLQFISNHKPEDLPGIVETVLRDLTGRVVEEFKSHGGVWPTTTARTLCILDQVRQEAPSELATVESTVHGLAFHVAEMILSMEIVVTEIQWYSYSEVLGTRVMYSANQDVWDSEEVDEGEPSIHVEFFPKGANRRQVRQGDLRHNLHFVQAGGSAAAAERIESLISGLRAAHAVRAEDRRHTGWDSARAGLPQRLVTKPPLYDDVLRECMSVVATMPRGCAE